jgi:hypothetical protein
VSRSRRHSPILSPASAAEWKRISSRRLRHAVRQQIGHGQHDALPLAREIIDVYDSPKDGGCAFWGEDHPDSQWKNLYARLMRK